MPTHSGANVFTAERNERVFGIVQEVAQYIMPKTLAPPREWIETNIRLKGQLSADSSRKDQYIDLDFTPHVIEPLEYCCLNNTNAECTLMFAERLGKTTIVFGFALAVLLINSICSGGKSRPSLSVFSLSPCFL